MQINYRVVVSILLSGLLGAAAPAAAGGGSSTFIDVGGNTSPQQGSSVVPDQGRRIDKPQTGLGNLSIPDTSSNPGRRSDNSATGKPVIEKPQTNGGGGTLPFSNGGVFPAGSTNLGQPSSQFCSSSDVTVGENTQSKLHCSNTAGGTLRH